MKKCCANCANLQVSSKMGFRCSSLCKRIDNFYNVSDFFPLYIEGCGKYFFRADEEDECVFRERTIDIKEDTYEICDFPFIAQFEPDAKSNRVFAEFLKYPKGHKGNIGGESLIASFFIGKTNHSGGQFRPIDTITIQKNGVGRNDSNIVLYEGEFLSGTYDFHTSLENEDEFLQLVDTNPTLPRIISLYDDGRIEDNPRSLYDCEDRDYHVYYEDKIDRISEHVELFRHLALGSHDFFRLLKNSFWKKLFEEHEEDKFLDLCNEEEEEFIEIEHRFD